MNVVDGRNVIVSNVVGSRIIPSIEEGSAGKRDRKSLEALMIEHFDTTAVNPAAASVRLHSASFNGIRIDGVMFFPTGPTLTGEPRQPTAKALATSMLSPCDRSLSEDINAK